MSGSISQNITQSPPSKYDVEIVQAAAALAGQFASRNPMPLAAIPSLVADIHAYLVKLVKTGGRLNVAEFAAPAEQVTTALLASSSPVQQHVAVDKDGSINRFKAEYVTGEDAKVKPFLPVESSVWSDKIICLQCGKSFATMKRHITTSHKMEVLDYRSAYGLSAEYPMICDDFEESRRALMLQNGTFKPLTKEDHARRRKDETPEVKTKIVSGKRK